MNAANEIAVEAFLSEEIQFLQIPIVIEETLAKTTTIAQPTMEDYIAINNEARQIATQIKNNL